MSKLDLSMIQSINKEGFLGNTPLCYLAVFITGIRV